MYPRRPATPTHTQAPLRRGFYFALDILRFPGKRSSHSLAATFAMTVENLRTGRCAAYLGGPGRSWVTEFVLDLIAGTFGQPQANNETQ
jgi:hypothetical protein